MANTTKQQLIDHIADRTDETKRAVKQTVQALLDAIIVELGKGKRLEIRDFGVFEIHRRKARTARNPRTLERVRVPPRRVVKFKPGRLMLETVNSKRGTRAR